MRRGFTIIESLCMLVAIFMVTWITAAALKKNGTWPFKPVPAAASDKPVTEGAK